MTTLFRNVLPEQSFTYHGVELKRLGAGLWACSNNGKLWYMNNKDKVEVIYPVVEIEDEDMDTVYPFNVFP